LTHAVYRLIPDTAIGLTILVTCGRLQ